MYDNAHKIFLYHMLKNGFLPVDKALQFCKAIKAETVKDLDTLKSFTSLINKEICKQDFKILLGTCEVTGERQVVLINTANDDISRLQNSFTQVELEFFQALLQEIVSSDEKRLAQISCLNLSSTLTDKLSRTDAEKLVNKWVRMGYLIVQNEYVRLGARCIMEFASYFRAHCKDYTSTCNLCSELVLTGRTCGSCKKTMHAHCLDKFLVKRNRCPKCKDEWHDHAGGGGGDNDSSLEETRQDDRSSSQDEESPDGPSQRKRRR